MTNISNYFFREVFCTNFLAGPLTWGIVAVPSAFVGLPASGWLLWVFFQKRRHGSPSNVYMENLTIMDLIFNLGLIPHVFNYLVTKNMLLFLFCSSLFTFNSCGRPLLMSFICIDSYMAVVHPITYMRIKNTRYRIVLSLLIWVVILLFYIYFVAFYLFRISVALSATVMAFCNVSVLYTLNKPDPSGRTDVHPQKQRALRVLIDSLIISSLTYPTALISYSVINVNQQLYCYVFFPFLIPCTLASSIMPLIHLRNVGCFKDLLLLSCIHHK